MKPPNFEIPDYWEPVALPFNMGVARAFAQTPANQISLRMSFFKNTKGHNPFTLEGKVWFGHGIEGPPQHVHGGVSSYVLDEAMGSVCWLNNYACVAKNLTCHFEKMTPIDFDHDIIAKIESVKDREVKVVSQIYSRGSGLVFSKADAVFYRLPKETIEKFKKHTDSSYNFDAVDYSGIS